MINPQVKQILEQMRGKSEGSAVQEFIKYQIEELSYLRGIQGSIEEKGRVVEARQEAIKILEKLFNLLEVPNKPIQKPKYN